MYLYLKLTDQLPLKQEYSLAELSATNNALALVMLRIRDGNAYGIKNNGILNKLSAEIIDATKKYHNCRYEESGRVISPISRDSEIDICDTNRESGLSLRHHSGLKDNPQHPSVAYTNPMQSEFVHVM